VDPVYGGGQSLLLSQFKAGYKRSTRKPESPLLGRLSLHAHLLRFAHPRTGEVIQVEAPLPDDLAQALRQLNKYGMKSDRRG